MGSSPHARGKPPLARALVCAMGLIPACAGKTPFWGKVQPNLWAHPRMRGENTTLIATLATITGSSPHARGKLSELVSAWCADGLIPACAGKTL